MMPRAAAARKVAAHARRGQGPREARAPHGLIAAYARSANVGAMNPTRLRAVRGARIRGALAALVALSLVLASCVPAAGRGTVTFVAAAEDLVAEIAALGPNLQPGPQMSFYTVETIGDRSITLVSTSTLAVTLLFQAAQRTRLSFTLQQRGDTVLLASSGTGAGAEADLDRVLDYLRTLFPFQ